MIPKIIHQIHLGDNPLSDKEVEWQKTWKKYNPDWNFIFWNDEKIDSLDLVNQKYIDDETHYSVKSDILRYEILYQYGGVYIDTDFECIRNIDEFIDHKSFIVCKQIDDKKLSANVCGAFLAASKFNKIIKKLNDGIADRSVTHKKSGPPVKYGPKYLEEIVPTKMWEDSKYVYPFMWYEKKKQPTEHDQLKRLYPDAVAVHHWSGSWMK